MDYDRTLPGLVQSADTRILFLVLDGLGGLPHPETGRTELETAHIPHLDALAQNSSCGLHDPVLPGITPGSGPGHLGIFGFDPVTVRVGRGVLGALGLGFDLRRGDVAARVNFCTLDAEGRVTDRRGGRIATELNRELVALLNRIRLDPVELFVETEKEHRALVVFRGQGLHPGIEDTDPQKTGVPPNPVRAIDPAAKKTAAVVERFLTEARAVLADRAPANGLLLRGFDSPVNLPGYREKFGLRAAALAVYPMYRGLARMVGMTVLDAGDTLDSQIAALGTHDRDFDFFFFHYKPSDSRGEDGDFEGKVRALEALDERLPEILASGFDVVVVTGDHSTPSFFRAHSWHPVPFLVHSKWCVGGTTSAFTEKAARTGMEGRLPARCLLPLALAHAGRLAKYGA